MRTPELPYGRISPLDDLPDDDLDLAQGTNRQVAIEVSRPREESYPSVTSYFFKPAGDVAARQGTQHEVLPLVVEDVGLASSAATLTKTD